MMQSLSSTVIQLQGVQVRGIGDPSPPNPPAPGRFGGGRPTSPLSSQQSPTATSPPGDDAASSSRQRRPRSRRDKDKRFTCDYEGCDKTYTRAEHLTRHKLNHGGLYKYVCRVDPTCTKRFVRGDLLARHEHRHSERKKKQIQSDEGHSPPARIAPSPPRSPTSDLTKNFPSMTVPVMSSPEDDDDRGSGPLSSPEPMSLENSYAPYPSPSPNRQGFVPGYSSAYAQPISTSPTNYNANDGGFMPINPQFSTNNIPTFDVGQPQYTMPSDPITIPQSAYGTSPALEGNPVFADFFATGDNMMLGPEITNQPQENWAELWNPPNTSLSWGSNVNTWEGPYEMQAVYSSQGIQDATTPMDNRRGSMYFPVQNIPVGALLSDGASYNAVPLVSMEVRNRIITHYLHWNLNDPRVRNNAKDLSPESLSDYINIYWREFHSQYPILHRPTTILTPNAHLPLFIAMITIGMSLGGDMHAHNLAVTIHEELRWSIYSSKTFRHPAKLWEMQTLLLREIFDKMMCGRHQHEMAHTFHGALLTLMRRGTTLEGYLYRENSQQDNLLEHQQRDSELVQRWHEWVEIECTKRVAYLAFIMDSQHAMMFGHAAVLSAHELNLHFPCKEDLWAAGTAVEWQRERQRQQEDMEGVLGFTETLKICMNEPNLAREKINLDPFGSFILLHGLICISWHLQQKAVISLGGVSTSSQSRATSPQPQSRNKDHWKLALERALVAWRSSTQFSNTAHPSTVKFGRSSLTLFRIANVTLHTSILDLQILAGLPKLMGKPVREDYAMKVILQLIHVWAISEGAQKAVAHACKLLNETLFSRHGMDYVASRQRRLSNRDGSYGTFAPMDSALDGILHGKWCLYLATLTLWAWGVVTSNVHSREGSVMMNGINYSNIKLEDSEGFGSYSDSDELRAWEHAQHYLKAMSAAATEKNALATTNVRTETRGLIITIRNLLREERWELLKEGGNLCDKILRDQHRGMLIGSEKFESFAWEGRRRSSIIMEP